MAGSANMNESRRLSKEVLGACRRLRSHLLFLFALYVISFVAGYVAVSASVPFAVELRSRLLKAVAGEAPFTTVTDVLRSGNLLLAVALTLLVNLSSGAFFSTTFIGVVPLLGAAGVSLVTFYRGLSLGVVYYAVLSQSPAAFILGAGTLILELGGYVFSGAAGINLSLSTVFPKRYGVEGRWAAFRKAWGEAARVYLVVVGLLLAGAMWEMVGLFLLLR